MDGSKIREETEKSKKTEGTNGKKSKGCGCFSDCKCKDCKCHNAEQNLE